MTLKWARRSRVSTERIFSAMVIVTANARPARGEEPALSPVRSRARNCHPVKFNDNIYQKGIRYRRQILLQSDTV